MSTTVKRAPPRRTVAQQRKPIAKPRKPSTIDRLLGALPVSEATLRRAATWSILGIAAALALAVASSLGLPGIVGHAIADATGRAGLRVKDVEIVGDVRMDANTVRAVALDQPSLALAAIDLDRIRQRLLRYGWVEDAQVSRRYPDTLLIRLTERTPVAVWQDRGELTLIDATGRQLDRVNADAMPNLPLVIGSGADREEPAYQTLLAAAPALKRRVKAATWIGNRRWDLTFDSGETLKLPEDDASAALMRFASVQRAHPLLGRGFQSFDMRVPGRWFARRASGALALDGAPALGPTRDAG